MSNSTKWEEQYYHKYGEQFHVGDKAMNMMIPNEEYRTMLAGEIKECGSTHAKVVSNVPNGLGKPVSTSYVSYEWLEKI